MLVDQLVERTYGERTHLLYMLTNLEIAFASHLRTSILSILAPDSYGEPYVRHMKLKSI